MWLGILWVRRKLWALACVAVLLSTACRAARPAESDGLSCEEGKAKLIEVLEQLPSEQVSTPTQVDLPTSAFAGAYRSGILIELAEPELRLNGVEIIGENREERVAGLRQALANVLPNDWSNSSPNSSPNGADTPLSLGVRHDTDMRTLHDYLRGVPAGLPIRLLFNTPPLQGDQSDPLSGELELPDQVLAELDPAKRLTLLRQGYAEYSTCPGVDAAAASVADQSAAERWPSLRPALLAALPACPCEQLQAGPLRRLLAAEQRAGSLGVGSVTAAFLRDWRCRASMPLASVQQLLDDIEEFDSEFSGDWQEDALVFDQVVTDERLLVYMCQAMPGDVAASLQRSGVSLYWKLPGPGSSCQAWRFEQLARGAPMGSLRMQEGPVRFHYRQAGNDVRLFGPVHDESLPTEQRLWPCDHNLHLDSVDHQSISLSNGGQWFFSEEACLEAPAISAKQLSAKEVAAKPGADKRGPSSSRSDPAEAAVEGDGVEAPRPTSADPAEAIRSGQESAEQRPVSATTPSRGDPRCLTQIARGVWKPTATNQSLLE